MEVSLLCEEEQEPQPQPSFQETKQTDDEDAELIFVGVEHVNKDAELIFVGVTSNSKPVISTILNRVTPGSRLRRNQGHRRRNTAHRLQPTSPAGVTPESEVVSVLPASPSESRSTDSPVVIEPLQESDYKNNSPQVVPSSSSKSCSPEVIFISSWRHPVKAALSVGGVKESPHVSKRHSASEVDGGSPQRPKLNAEVAKGASSALSPPGTCHAGTQQSAPSGGGSVTSNRAQSGPPSPATVPEDSIQSSPTSVNPDRENGLSKSDCSGLESQKETSDPKKGNLILLLSDFYYGHHRGNAQAEQKTHSAFKCLLCLKVLKNIKFMNHVKHHLELEKQSGDSWEKHATCQHCHRHFPTPFQLERHVDNVHTAQDSAAVCKICELSFETDQVLLQHMKDNHKPGEMPYVCLVCNYRSSVFADVDAHFRKCHINTKNLLCPFCLKIFKTGTPYMCHYRGHWERSVHQCSKCRLQFLTFKEKMEHKTQCHQMFKKPKQLEGLPPETKVVIQVSLEPGQSASVKVASITVSCDSEPSSLRSKGRISKKPH